MADFISRQAALEALTIEYNAVGILGEQWAVSQCIDAVNKLPTIDPVKHGEWIKNNGRMRILYEIGGVPCRACGVEDMFEYLDDAPVVIPAERRKDDQKAD